MKIKQVPEDFVVNEIYNLEDFKERDEGRGDYYYFKLIKTDYTQMRAIERVAKIFSTSRKLVHFAGTKDKTGITSQLISVYGINEKTFDSNVEFFNENVTDMSLEFLGKFKGRVNLGDNGGNKFEIVVRDLDSEEIAKAKENILSVEKNGVLNYFDSQRFGFANNSHKIGLFILKNDLKSAIYEILTSLPPNPSENLNEFVNSVKSNWEAIVSGEKESIRDVMSKIPNFFSEAKFILGHLHNYKGDFHGAFRTIHKKLRTLYFNAYQSYIFNTLIEMLPNHETFPLITAQTKLEGDVKLKVEELLTKDGITQEMFELKHMPELTPQSDIDRTVRLYPKNFKVLGEGDDELNDGKLFLKVSFDLESGAYATNVIKQLFI